MSASAVPPAVAAASSIASALGLKADDAVVLQATNRLTLRLLPCDVLARVGPGGHQEARLEIELAQQLADFGSPVAVPDPRVEPRVYPQNGYAVTFWTYYEPVASAVVSPVDYASALHRLHGGMRMLATKGGCCLLTWRRAAGDRSNSTSPMRPRKSANTIPVST